jgi:hypothetical protein
LRCIVLGVWVGAAEAALEGSVLSAGYPGRRVEPGNDAATPVTASPDHRPV